MWLATKHGFYSIVQKSPGEYHVRGRMKRDLQNLLHLLELDTEIQCWPAADYRFRFIVGETDFFNILSALGASVDYADFKGEISRLPDQQKRLNAYNRIWATMAHLQDIQETLAR